MSVQLAEKAARPAPAVSGLEVAAPVRTEARGDGGDMPVSEIREISRAMFLRLTVLEEGTSEYQEVRNTLIELNMALVRFAARRFSNHSDQMEDILQVGTIGLIKAVDRFDPDFGTEFVTFAMPTITGEIKRFFRDTSWAVRVPRRLQELRLDMAKASDAFVVEYDRSPTSAELAERLGIAEEEVVEARVAANAYTASSLDAQLDDEDDEGTAWANRVGLEDPGLEGVENLTSLKPLIAQLPERERVILAMRFSGDMTQAAIGEELGLSQMHISRLLTRALATLRRQLLTET
jgi:RNA polymerase sigma-B factor